MGDTHFIGHVIHVLIHRRDLTSYYCARRKTLLQEYLRSLQ